MHVCLIGLEALSVLMPGFEGYRIGGEQVQVSLLAKALVKNGYKVSLIVFDYGQDKVLCHEGINVIALYAPNAGLPVLRFIYPRVIKLWLAMKVLNADVYYTSCAGYMVGIVGLFCRLNKKKAIFRVAHDSDCEPDKLLIDLWRDKKIYEYGLRRQNEVLVQSHQQAEALYRNYGLHSSLAGMFVDKPKKLLDYEDRDIGVLWVNNIRQFKRPDLVIELAKNNPDLDIHMIGGPNDQDLYEKIKKSAESLQNIKFYGAVPYKDISKYYSRARVFVNTSDSEGFPNSYLQSWIRGTPIVVFFDPDGKIMNNNLGYAANSLAEMSDILRRFSTDKMFWKEYSDKCIDYMNTHYSDEKIIEPYLRAIHR